MIRIGTAGWGLPAMTRRRFPGEGTILERYAAVFPAVEINSSFYRPHRPQTYERWAASTPPGFRFALKAPKAITHGARLADCGARLADFRGQAQGLGDRLGPLLVQLPPSLAFDAATARQFFEDLRMLWPETVACEPRHSSWFGAEAEDLLIAFEVARVAADPAPDPRAAHPGGWPGLAYWRLHGSPKMYVSTYGPERLARLRATLARSEAGETWCIFDNTAAGAAAANALDLMTLISGAGP
ncbi:MAG: DUF72 domain-containing protein [Caulobacteraceae bacterium]